VYCIPGKGQTGALKLEQPIEVVFEPLTQPYNPDNGLSEAEWNSWQDRETREYGQVFFYQPEADTKYSVWCEQIEVEPWAEGSGDTRDDVSSNSSNIPYRTFVDVNSSAFPTINKQYFIDNPSDTLRIVSDDTGVRRALRLSDTKLLLMAASSHNMHIAYLVYDEITEEVVREVSFPTLALYTWYDNSTVVYVAGQANRIVMTDYLKNKTVVLYEESDPNVQLVEVWEMGQVGKLEVEEDSVVFGRYRKLPGTTATESIEEVRVPIPQSFLLE
jgi:hypothetical protein